MQQHVVVLSFLISLLLSPAARGYDRSRATNYARTWSTSDGIANTVVYVKYESGKQYDCTNFVSQCLIAGGVYFRDSSSAGDNTRPQLGTELETHQTTHAIRNSDRRYSRVITGPQILKNSLETGRHGLIKEFSNPKDFGTPTFWNTMERGDVVLLYSDYEKRMGHGLFITSVDGRKKKIKVCAHSYWRCDEDLDTAVPGWRQGTFTHFYHLPDAPVVAATPPNSASTNAGPFRYLAHFFTSHGNVDAPSAEVAWYAGSMNRGNMYGPSPRLVSDDVDRLDVQLTFDCPMDHNITVKLASRIFLGITGGGWKNGWWTGAPDVNHDLWTNQTWRGMLTQGLAIQSRIPDVRGLAVLQVQAKSVHSDGIDLNNDLTKYVPGTMKVFKVFLDRRPTNGGRY